MDTSTAARCGRAMSMMRKGSFISLAAAFLALPGSSWGQRASNWRVYKMADGLPESACVSVNVGQQGRILAKHLNRSSVSELDGYSVNVLPPPDSGPNRIFASPAGQLWAVTTEGLREFRDGAWAVHSVPEIAAQFRGGQVMRAVPLCPVRQGVVLFLLPDSLMEFNVESPDRPRVSLLRAAAQTRLEQFSGLSLSRDGGLWISGLRGLAKVHGPARNLKPDSEWVEHLPPESLDLLNFQDPWEDAIGGVTLLADESRNLQKRIAHFDGQRWTALSAGGEKIRRAWRGPDQTFWAATISALFQSEPGSVEMLENQEISARAYYDVAVEPGGAFWLATSDGLFRYALLAWQSPTALRKVNSPVQAFAEDPQGRLWFVSASGLHVMENEVHREHPFSGDAALDPQTASILYALEDGSLLLDQGDKLFQFHPAERVYREVAPRRRFRPLGQLSDTSACLLNYGPDSAADSRLELYDGRRFLPFPWPLPGTLSPDSVTTFFTARNGDVWLGTEDGIACFREKKWQSFPAADKSNPAGALAFAEMPEERIWCATLDNIWEFDGKNWLIVRTGFDHVNALLRSRDSGVWIASNSGLHRYHENSWIDLGLDDGLPSGNVRTVFQDRRNRIWAGTALGVSLYDKGADSDPPEASIPERPESENIVPEGGTIVLTFTGQDKWKQTPRHRLLYSYRLDEHDWSLFNEPNTMSFTDLPAGKHHFWVRAMDRSGNASVPTKLDFAVAVPWYRETRLVAIAFAGLAVALFFAALAFNRHLQLLRSYAEVERKVAERTQELERAGRELLHSQKMNALGTLAAGLAHDFNNILSIVKGSAQIIEDNLSNPEKIRTRTDRIRIVTDQGAGIVKALLGFSRDSAQQPAVCDLNAVVDDTIKLLGDRFLREVEIVFDRTPGLPEVRATRDFIQQILLNFIFNAAESMTRPQGRRVIIATRRLDALPAGLVLKPATAPACVAVSVQDFGSGISPENLPRIFEPFFTTKALSTRRGTGLGLSMAYELAKKLDAGLAVESVVNSGTTITLILPVHDLPATSKAESHASS